MDNQVAEKIKKLLSLATSSNPHEAELAMRKAQELMIRHNLEMQDLPKTTESYDKVILSEGRASLEHKFIISILQDFFFVKLVNSQKHGVVFMLGEKTNIEIAGYVYNFLSVNFRAAFKRSGFGQDARSSFYLGLHKGMRDQLTAQKQASVTETGLVVREDAGLTTFMHGQFPTLKHSNRKSTVSVRSSEAKSAGYESGKNMKIARRLESNGSGPALALGYKK